MNKKERQKQLKDKQPETKPILFPQLSKNVCFNYVFVFVRKKEAKANSESTQINQAEVSSSIANVTRSE